MMPPQPQRVTKQISILMRCVENTYKMNKTKIV